MLNILLAGITQAGENYGGNNNRTKKRDSQIQTKSYGPYTGQLIAPGLWILAKAVSLDC